MALTKVQSEMAGAGQVLQVVNTTYATQTTITSTSYTDTGLTASITPKLSTSTILIIATVQGIDGSSSNFPLGIALRNGSQIGSEFFGAAGYNNNYASAQFNYKDSPATTSAITYKIQFKSQTGGQVVVQNNSSQSGITLMEIAG